MARPFKVHHKRQVLVCVCIAACVSPCMWETPRHLHLRRSHGWRIIQIGAKTWKKARIMLVRLCLHFLILLNMDIHTCIESITHTEIGHLRHLESYSYMKGKQQQHQTRNQHVNQEHVEEITSCGPRVRLLGIGGGACVLYGRRPLKSGTTVLSQAWLASAIFLSASHMSLRGQK